MTISMLKKGSLKFNYRSKFLFKLWLCLLIKNKINFEYPLSGLGHEPPTAKWII